MEITNDALDKAVRDSFVDSYLSDGITDTMRREALGMLVASYCHWDGGLIMEVIHSALEDANYHSLNTKIKELYISGGA